MDQNDNIQSPLLQNHSEQFDCIVQRFGDIGKRLC